MIKPQKIVAVLLFIFVIVTAWLYFNSKHELDMRGGCDQTQSPYMPDYTDPHKVISYCEGGDKYTGELFTGSFQAGEHIYFFYAGYPEEKDIDVFFESDSGQRSLILLSNAGESWKLVNIIVPQEFDGQRVQLVASDQSMLSRGWVGIGTVTIGLNVDVMNLFMILIVISAIYMFLVVWLAVFQRYTSSELAPIYLIIFLGLAGYASFWIYYGSSPVGKVFSASLLAVTFILGGMNWRKYGGVIFSVANGVLLPVALYTLFIMIVGYFPFEDVSSTAAMSRWLNLPIDNKIPQIFANQIQYGQVKSPMVGDWLSSDRPPLQTGIYLMSMLRSDLFYQVLSSMVQSLVLIPFIMLVRRLGYSQLAVYALIAFGFTSLVALHTLYVWPKLISTAYLIIFYLLTMTTLGKELGRGEWWFLAGASVALAMLSHGGAVFALLAVGICYLVRYRVGAFTMGLPAAIFSLILYFPWLLYQQYLDPPGNRLVKWHLAGMVERNELSTIQALQLAYGDINLQSWIDGRVSNLLVIFANATGFVKDVLCVPFGSDLAIVSCQKQVILNSFYGTIYSLWWFNPILAVIIWSAVYVRRRQTFDADVIWLAVASVLTLIIWSVLMYIPGSTVIHQGSFLPWVSLFIFSSILMWQVSYKMFMLFAALNTVVFIKIYILNTDIGLEYLSLTVLVMLAFAFSCVYSSRCLDMTIKKGMH